MAKKPIQVVYNHKPDPVTKITEFEIDKPKPKKKNTLENTFDQIDHLEKRMLLNEQMEDN